MSEFSLIAQRFVIILCTETLVSDVRDKSVIFIPNINKPVLIERGLTIEQEEWVCTVQYIRLGYCATHPPKMGDMAIVYR